ncbi:MAG: hypothetical protein HFI75_10150 [Lachnospiraceae bacterium]|nr:hypothetical protein [Lachnospiraceae bacterium]
MYITEKYWGNYIGDTDDSLTLEEYLTGKHKEELPVAEIFSDFGLDQLQGNFRQPEQPLVFVNEEEWEFPIYYAIDLITDLAALLLECKVNGSVDLQELCKDDEVDGLIRITTTPEEHTLINETLKDFALSPLAYDVSEMDTKEHMKEMAAVCEELRQELYGSSR